MIVAILSFAILTLIYFIMKSNMSDPYGTFHLALNIHPDSDKPKDQRRTTEWLNMGYWKDRKSFPEACEALALKIIQEGRPIPNGHVLDVGHGCGDSLLLYLTNPSIPIPETLSGITSLKTHSVRAQNRISVVQNTQGPVSSCQVRFWCADAVYSPENSPSDHPLCPSSSLLEPLYTTITAIDCAYHFTTREIFLQQCFTRLAPGGRIALADLTISKPLPLLLHFVVTTFLSVRKENLLTIDEYEACLIRAGYVDIKIEDISNDVFPRFLDFLKSKGGLWYFTSMIFRRWYTAGGQFVVVGASKPK